MKTVGLTALALLGLLLPLPCFAAETAPGTNTDQAVAVQGNNAFAVELYQHLKDQPGNLFFSPESISTALAMTYAGARSQTATEMAKVLHFTLSPDKLHPAMGKLLAERNAAHDGYQLKESDALWGQQGCHFLPDFLALTKTDYGAAFNTVDFAKNDEATQIINNWVAQQTNDKITNLIAQGILTPKTRLVLTNAIYFTGEWETQFKKEDTKDENFFVAPMQAVKVPMMHRTGRFQYFDGGTFQALAIPYKGKELSMVIFLPKQVDGLAAFEQSLTPDKLQRWISQLRATTNIIVALPTFEMTKECRLDDVLEAMGMQHAFGRRADFSRMVDAKGLYISAVLHNAYINVNEKGTEATATTAVVIDGARVALASPSAPPTFFRADHKFLFVIRDNDTGGILFIGRVAHLR